MELRYLFSLTSDYCFAALQASVNTTHEIPTNIMAVRLVLSIVFVCHTVSDGIDSAASALKDATPSFVYVWLVRFLPLD